MENSLKILYLISTRGHGRGGHFYDLRDISECLSNKLNVHILNIGSKVSPVINSGIVPVIHLQYNGLNYITVIYKVLALVRNGNFTHLHAFDIESYSFACIVGVFTKIPVILSKCGGPNPEGFYPYANNLVVMSEENKNYFQNNSKYKNVNMHYIPNRTKTVGSDQNRIVSLKKCIRTSMVFLRISRINNYYEESLKQAIKTVKDLKKGGYRVSLVIVWVIENKEILYKLQHLADCDYVHFLTSSYYTINASELIDAADFVIGTGRGLMEAASKGKVLLTPLRMYKHSVLITKNNFSNLFKTNFSPRNRLNNYSETKNFCKIELLLKDREKFNQMQKFSKMLFKKYFSADHSIEDYQKLYSDSNFAPKIIKFCELIINSIYTIKKFLILNFHNKKNRKVL